MVKIPSIDTLYNNILQDMQAQLGVTIPSWKKSLVKVLAMAMAAQHKLSYIAINNVQKNMAPDLADSEADGGTLERFGRLKLGRSPFPAVAGKYSVTVTGSVGATIPVGTTFKSTDASSAPNQLYIVDTAVTLASSSAPVVLRALQAGTMARLVMGDILSITAPVIGVDSRCVVMSTVTEATDAESTEAYRKAVVESYQLLPQGGSSADYRLWAKDAAGVYQVYPYTSSTPAEVDVYVEAVAGDSIDGMGTPSSATLSAVSGVLNTDPVTGYSRRPLGVVNINVMPVSICSVSVEFADFVDLDLAKTSAIGAALEELVNGVRPFIPGAEGLADRNDTLSVNMIIHRVLEVLPGATFGGITLSIAMPGQSPSVVTAHTFTNGIMPYLNSVTYA